MIDTRFLESFLRLNNVSANASAAEIQTVLTAAHWPAKEIEEALIAHSGGAVAKTYAQKPEERAFRPDMDWSSSRLSSLLGIDVVVDPKSFRASVTKEHRLQNTGKKLIFGIGIAAIAVAIAAILGFGLMYLFEIGPFYTKTVEII